MDYIEAIRIKTNISPIESEVIKDYDARKISEKFSTPGEVLRHLLEKNNLRQSHLSGMASQGVISELVNGKRQLTLKHTLYLSKRFDVSPLTFMLNR